MQNFPRTTQRIDYRFKYPAELIYDPPRLLLIAYLLASELYTWLVMVETPSLILLASFSRLLDLLVNEAIAGGDIRAEGDILGDEVADEVTGPLPADDCDDGN